MTTAGLSQDVSECLDSGLRRLFAVDQEGDRLRGLQELLARCGFARFSDLQAAVYDRHRSQSKRDQDRDLLAPLSEESWLLFMNHGYAPGDGEERDFPPLDGEYARWRHQVFLYFSLLKSARARLDCMTRGECDLLDVGCGRGGGLAAMKRYYGLRRAVGIDANSRQVAFCVDRHRGDRLEFSVGSATEIPLEADAFDVVTNVESSHGYDDLPRFLSEVRRVLRRGGLLLLADNRESAGGTRLMLDAALVGSGLRLLHKEDITERVSRACRLDSERFASQFPGEKTETIRDISAGNYDAYRSGKGAYLSYVLENPPCGPRDP